MKMVDVSETRVIEQINEVGKRLLLPPKSTPQLLKLLDEVEILLTKVGQAPSHLVQVALLIPMKALIADELFKHSDPNVRITVASCLNEVTRITAPIPPYEDDKMREFFELIVASFENLSCQFGRCYSKAVSILQNAAKLRSCVMLLDLDCDPLVTKMFEVFQKNISPKHPQAVLLAMVDIMSVLVQESDSVCLELLKILLASIKTENQSVLPASWELGVKIVERCADKLSPFIMETVASMGCCLEDFAPILASICNPKPDSATKVMDSSFLVNNEPSGNSSHRAECVQSLEAPESFEHANTLATGGNASETQRKLNSQNPNEEATGMHPVNNESSGNQSHPAEFVQALEASESFEHVKFLGTEGSACERGIESKSQDIIQKATGLEHEHDRVGTPVDDVYKKDEGFKTVKEEAVGLENKQASVPSALGTTRRKRGRPRKNEVSGVSGSCAPDSSRKKSLKQHGFSADNATETADGRKNYEDDLVGRRIRVWWPLDRRYYVGTVTMFDASLGKHKVDYDDGDEEILNLRRESWEFIGDAAPADIRLNQEKQDVKLPEQP